MFTAKIDYVEFLVSNIHHAVHFYRNSLGFKKIAYLGPETGVHDKISFIMEQGNIRIILTSTVNNKFILNHINKHGDGVHDIAFVVSNVQIAFEHALKHGAQAVLEPTIFEDKECAIKKATIQAFGDTTHTLIERNSSDLFYLPYYKFLSDEYNLLNNFHSIDHFAICTHQGTMNDVARFYKNVFLFTEIHNEYVHTGKSGMNSKVVQSPFDGLKITIAEPVNDKCRSQIEDYIHNYGSAGIQHVAFTTENILQTVKHLKNAGVDFLLIPPAYYEMNKDKFTNINEDIHILQKYGILIDSDEKGYLYQIFSKPIQNRATYFFEIIQRRGATGFGSNNIKALFQAMEQEQINRGAT